MKSKVDADKINLLFVKTLKSNIEVGSNFIKEEGQEYHLSLGQESGLNLDEKKIAFTLKVLIEFPNTNEDAKAQAEFVLQFLFEIENLDKLVTLDDEGAITVSGELSMTLAGISYSTARGIILNTTEQSTIRGILLPVISPAKLFTKGKIQL
ncbi:hypothetical protein [Brumimicrobium oceani]|uniref:Preprotein translocase subunit SecB n=1 Tax=Brumimicrobium oceani TaxID=2100725 RepID=A0A2U2XD31_9FLAO|nr:hypothetical protein [Brumimicrobium oceani]PWH85705.1 hypothetical protein DIT68_08720 [Brumimicrobium oceani]